ncbi:MAG: ribosomal protein L34 [Planctomycetota bacterium]|jgi:ribosomal protein L34
MCLVPWPPGLIPKGRIHRVPGQSRERAARANDPMKLKIRNSKAKKAKKTGFLTRQKTVGGRKINKRHRARHGSF